MRTGVHAAALIGLAAASVGAQEIGRTEALATRAVPIGAASAVIERAEIQASGARTLAELLAGRVAGLSVTFGSGIHDTPSRIHVRGSPGLYGTPEPLLYVDGTLVRDARVEATTLTSDVAAATLPLVSWDLSTDEIERVEVVLGPAGGAFLDFGASRGAVLVTTVRPEGGARSVRVITDVVSTGAPSTPDFHGTTSGSYPGDALPCTLSHQALGVCTATALVRWNPVAESAPLSGGVDARARVRATGVLMGVGAYRVEGAVQQGGANGFSSGIGRTSIFAAVSSREAAPLVLAAQLRSSRANGSAVPWDGYLRGALFNLQDNGRGAPGDSLRVGLAEALILDRSSMRTSFSTEARWRVSDRLHTTVGLTLDHETNGVDFGNKPYGAMPGVTSAYDGEETSYGLRGRIAYSHALPAGFAGVARAGAALLRSDDRSRVVSPSTSATSDVQIERRSLLLVEELSRGAHRTLGVGVRYEDISGFGVLGTPEPLPVVYASWVMSDESYFPTNTLVSELRLRAAHSASYDQEAIPGDRTGPVLLPRLELTKETEYGVSAALLGGRVAFDATRFSRATKNSLFENPIPATAGFATELRNFVGFSHSGLDLRVGVPSLTVGPVAVHAALTMTLLDRVKIRGPFLPFMHTPTQWDFFFVYSDRPLGVLYELDPLVYSDSNGDGIIDSTEVTSPVTQSTVGNTVPDRIFGLTSTAKIGARLQVGLQLDGKGGHLRRNAPELMRCRLGACESVHSPDASLDDQARAVAARHLFRYQGFLEDAGFVKLREVWMRYSLSGTGSPLGTRETTLIVSARNIFTWTEYSGEDPEVGTFLAPTIEVVSPWAQALLPTVAVRLEIAW